MRSAAHRSVNHVREGDMPPISDTTWERLVSASRKPWADFGVFGTALGPEYVPGTPGSLLYVGKSAGPLGAKVGSVYAQAASAEASKQWMIGMCDRSPFWRFIDDVRGE